MKEQINSVRSLSLKGKITVTILCTMLGTTSVIASNNLLTNSRPLTKEIKTDIEIANGIDKPAYPFIDHSSLEADAEEITIVIEQWLAESSYWNSDESQLNDQPESDGTEKLEKSSNCPVNIVIENNPFLFNAESYIPESEF